MKNWKEVLMGTLLIAFAGISLSICGCGGGGGGGGGGNPAGPAAQTSGIISGNILASSTSAGAIRGSFHLS